jgi:hypothetical protein
MGAEHKTVAGYQRLQLEDYAQDLAEMQNATLMTVVEHPAQAPVGPWSVTTWAAVAAEAVAILRRSQLGVRWRRAAWAPDTPARLLVLAELLEYLDQEHHIVSDPLTTSDLVAFAGAPQAWNTLHALMARVCQLSGEPFSEDVGWEDDGSAAWLCLDSRPEDWWSAYDGFPEIHLSVDDSYFGTPRRGEPAIGVGIDLPPGYGDTVYTTHVNWLSDLRAANLDPYPDQSWLRIYRTTYLAEVHAAGVTLEEQADFVARRFKEALDDLRSKAPPTPLTLPPKRGARRQAPATPIQADTQGGDEAGLQTPS